MKLKEEQLKSLNHYMRMFEYNAERIEKLCDEERHDIRYGFELGQVYSHLRECYLDMLTLLEEIEEKK